MEAYREEDGNLVGEAYLGQAWEDDHMQREHLGIQV